MNDYLTTKEIEAIKGPVKNPKAILIVQQDDGNWRGFAQKNGKLVQTRQGDPGTVLQMLITHDGTQAN